MLDKAGELTPHTSVHVGSVVTLVRALGRQILLAVTPEILEELVCQRYMQKLKINPEAKASATTSNFTRTSKSALDSCTPLTCTQMSVPTKSTVFKVYVHAFIKSQAGTGLPYSAGCPADDRQQADGRHQAGCLICFVSSFFFFVEASVSASVSLAKG